MRGLRTIISPPAVAADHALAQNLRRGHYELTVELPRLRDACTDLADCL